MKALKSPFLFKMREQREAERWLQRRQRQAAGREETKRDGGARLRHEAI